MGLSLLLAVLLGYFVADAESGLVPGRYDF